MYRSYVLTIYSFGVHSEGRGSRGHVAGGSFQAVRVLRVGIILTDVNYRQLPKLGHVHFLVENSLSKSSFAEETHGNLSGAEIFRGERCARCDSNASGDDRVRAQIAGGRIGDVHRSAFPFAVARLFTEKLGEHAVGRRAFSQTMPVAAMSAGDVVLILKRFANSHGHCFFTHVKVRETRHQRAGVKLVYLLFKQKIGRHLALHAKPFGRIGTLLRLSFWIWLARDGAHFSTPHMRASTSNTTAKSFFSKPMARAAVKNSLLTAVVGSGTLSRRPNSIASSMSFCIMFTSNQASSGIRKIKGPRY